MVTGTTSNCMRDHLPLRCRVQQEYADGSDRVMVVIGSLSWWWVGVPLAF
ncbi:unannotated protein [freshwater metagenome]|uniref:Unannotated protein n=1 Tax=freshwater metagenome TaxID=449393 RepID=A0A6J7I3D4_9ZZZZ